MILKLKNLQISNKLSQMSNDSLIKMSKLYKLFFESFQSISDDMRIQEMLLQMVLKRKGKNKVNIARAVKTISSSSIAVGDSLVAAGHDACHRVEVDLLDNVPGLDDLLLKKI